MEDKFSFAKELIKEASLFIKNRMQDNLSVQIKSNYDDLVTNVDQETQDMMIKRILEHFPDDHILAEEDDVRHPICDGNVWVIDPIDGTVNFISQGNHFAIMLAYYENGQGKFGLIYDVMNDQLLSGGEAFDVYLNEKKLSPYQTKPLSRSLIACNSGMYLNNDFGVTTLIKHSLGVRIYGGAGISMLKVMTGELLAYFSDIQPWDYAAAMIIGKKLGFVLLTLNGDQPDFETRQKVMFLPACELNQLKNYLVK